MAKAKENMILHKHSNPQSFDEAESDYIKVASKAK